MDKGWLGLLSNGRPWAVRLLKPQNEPVHLGPAGHVFRALPILGTAVVIALAANILAHPEAAGLYGQRLLFRVIYGLVTGPAILLVSVLILRRLPGNFAGRLMALMAIAVIGAQFDFELGSSALSAIAVDLFFVYGPGIVAPAAIYFMFTFPDNNVFPSRLTSWVRAFVFVKFAGAPLEIMASSSQVGFVPLAVNPLYIEALGPFQPGIARTIGITGLMLPLGIVGGVVSLILRYRTSSSTERQQIKWVVWAFGVFILIMLATIGVLSQSAIGSASLTRALLVATGLGQTLIVASVAISILRHQLFDIDVIIQRTLVYGALTALIVGLYILIVGSIGTLLRENAASPGRSDLMISLLATGLVAVLFQPLRDRLQRGANRLLYGERDEPYAVLSRLGERLGATPVPGEVLPVIVETVAQTLKLPYVAIALKRDKGREPTAAFGTPGSPVHSLPLVYQNEEIGEMVVAQRGPGDPLTPADRRLLMAIAKQVGPAAYAVRLTADLQRSRERLITTREEERRRLRRDLHDGLGPTLATLALKTDTARNLLKSDIAAVDALLVELQSQLESALGDIRRLVYELRPPALDELGLVGALKEQGLQYEQNGLSVSIDAPQPLPALSAAVEVALYRITAEALTNAMRHAQASICKVRFSVPAEDTLQLEIADNGVGISPETTKGVGLNSMRERASELGGTCAIQERLGGGTLIIARLPLSLPEAQI